MSNTKMRPTAAEHQDVGARLSAINNELVSLHVFLDGKYPHSERYVRLVDSAIRAVNKAKCEGDSVAAQEHPDEFSPRWYYGGSRFVTLRRNANSEPEEMTELQRS